MNKNNWRLAIFFPTEEAAEKAKVFFLKRGVFLDQKITIAEVDDNGYVIQ